MKERKVLKRQQEVEEMKKNEMLIVHKQRQQDMDAVKEENDKQKSAVSFLLLTIRNFSSEVFSVPSYKYSYL